MCCTVQFHKPLLEADDRPQTKSRHTVPWHGVRFAGMLKGVVISVHVQAT